jgi:transposase
VLDSNGHFIVVLVDIFRKVDTMSAIADTRRRRARRRFTDDFKQQAVRLVLDEGKSVSAVARELDLVASALGNWVKRAQADRSKGRAGLTTAEREELVRLRKALRIAEEERDILRNESRALALPDLWARNSRAYAHTPGAVAVRFLVTSQAR